MHGDAAFRLFATFMSRADSIYVIYARSETGDAFLSAPAIICMLS
jgi:hypothetical protein